MERMIGDVLLEIAKEYDNEESIIEPVIKKLKEQFYVKMKDLKHLNNQQWIEFKLPHNLYHLLMKKYHEEVAKEQGEYKPMTNSMAQSCLVNHSIGLTLEDMPMAHKESKSSKPLIPKEDIETTLEIIYVEIDNQAKANQVFPLLEGLFFNIINNPLKEEYKRLNTTKLLHDYPYQSIINFFLLCQYKSIDDQYMFFKGSIKALEHIMKVLMEFNQHKGFQQVQKDNTTVKSDSIAKSKESPSSDDKLKVDFNALYNEEFNRRENAINAAIILRNPRCNILSEALTINDIMIEMNEEPVNDNRTEEDIASLSKGLSLIKLYANDKATIESRSKYEYLIKSQMYLMSSIRFIFPNNYLLKGDFGLKETIQNVYDFINDYITNPGENQYILSLDIHNPASLPKDKTIRELELYPKAMVYVLFSNMLVDSKTLIKEGEWNKVNINSSCLSFNPEYYS